MQKTIGGDRLGAGRKIKVDLHGWGRSTFNQSRIWRSTMAPGTLVPCFVEVGLNGTTFDIDINTLAHTIPTISPLFGSFKMQVDMFACPVRLYQGILHNNAVNIGMNMSKVLLPKISIATDELNGHFTKTNTSSLLNYLGIKGANEHQDDFNAIPLIAYYDIFKNYYANKQESQAKVIATTEEPVILDIVKAEMFNPTKFTSRSQNINYDSELLEILPEENRRRLLNQYSTGEGGRVTEGQIKEGQRNVGYYESGFEGGNEYSFVANSNGVAIEKVEAGGDHLKIYLQSNRTNINGKKTPDFELGTFYINIENAAVGSRMYGTPQMTEGLNKLADDFNSVFAKAIYNKEEQSVEIWWTKTGFLVNNPQMTITMTAKSYVFGIEDFPLENIDNARKAILKKTDLLQRIVVNTDLNFLPYSTNIIDVSKTMYSHKLDKQGLMLKTYKNDIFNTWLSTDYIDLINSISGVAVGSGQSLTMDALILAKKVYNMLNRVAVSGGTYEDWQEANFGELTNNRAESPIYIGGTSAIINFEEVVSTAGTENQPLATLGGKGIITNKKGGSVIYKCDEPCFIIGIASITPNIDYHQGNKWFTTALDNMDNFHKPALDGIGFQTLTENQVHWKGNPNIGLAKQPAWIHYQTAVNEVFGQFAKDIEDGEENDLSQMVLRRDYEVDEEGHLNDFTTYIDPSKYNYAFAVNGLESENFWVQLGFEVKSRRKMAAYEIPNL